MKTNQLLLKAYKENKETSNTDIALLVAEKIKDSFKPNDAFNSPIDMVLDSMDYAELFYIDYINNYLTADRMCEDYYISIELCNEIIELGRLVNNNK